MSASQIRMVKPPWFPSRILVEEFHGLKRPAPIGRFSGYDASPNPRSYNPLNAGGLDDNSIFVPPEIVSIGWRECELGRKARQLGTSDLRAAEKKNMFGYMNVKYSISSLVGGLVAMFYFPINIGLRLSSQLTNSNLFQRGGPGPPTSSRLPMISIRKKPVMVFHWSQFKWLWIDPYFSGTVVIIAWVKSNLRLFLWFPRKLWTSPVLGGLKSLQFPRRRRCRCHMMLYLM